MECNVFRAKSQNWQSESDNGDFEIASKLCFVTGVSKGPPDEWNVEDLRPLRHGVDETTISNAPEMVRLSPTSIV